MPMKQAIRGAPTIKVLSSSAWGLNMGYGFGWDVMAGEIIDVS